jgi:MraZ protein
LYGEHELTIDDKNRLLVPSEIRKAIDVESYGDAFFGIVGVNRRIWLYPDKYYQIKLDASEAEMTPQDELVDFNHVNFAMTAHFTVDKAGRILLDEKLMRRTGLKREVTLIGARDHLECWNRADWESRFNELLGKPGEVATKARQARRETQPRVP